MIVRGSMSYTTSGRKKKFISSKKKKPPFIPLAKEKAEFRPTWWQRKTTEYKSAPFRPHIPKKFEDTSYRQEVSSKYTVAPAYNKGAYQVIPQDDIENIGR